MNARWPRALVRAALREAGYDAVGAAGLAYALRYAVDEPARGGVRAVVVDSDVEPAGNAPAWRELVEKHGRPATILIQAAGRFATDSRWTLVLRRPLSVGDIVAAVQRLLPLPVDMRTSLDD